jgi:hypothetical protein
MMKFAKIAFWVAGIWGLLVLTPLVWQGRMHQADLVFAGTGLLLGVLFVIAYFKTRARSA